MNDIEILENYLKYIKQFDNNSDFIPALENLIQRNKDLEEIEKEHKEENGRLRDKIKELEEECKKVVIAPEGTCFLLKEKDIIPKLKAKLERDIEIYSREGCCRKQVREGIVREAKEISELLEESEK